MMKFERTVKRIITINNIMFTCYAYANDNNLYEYGCHFNINQSDLLAKWLVDGNVERSESKMATNAKSLTIVSFILWMHTCEHRKPKKLTIS